MTKLQGHSPGRGAGRAVRTEEGSSSSSTTIEEREIELFRKEGSKVGAVVLEVRPGGFKPEVKRRMGVVSQWE